MVRSVAGKYAVIVFRCFLIMSHGKIFNKFHPNILMKPIPNFYKVTIHFFTQSEKYHKTRIGYIFFI